MLVIFMVRGVKKNNTFYGQFTYELQRNFIT